MWTISIKLSYNLIAYLIVIDPIYAHTILISNSSNFPNIFK